MGTSFVATYHLDAALIGANEWARIIIVGDHSSPAKLDKIRGPVSAGNVAMKHVKLVRTLASNAAAVVSAFAVIGALSLAAQTPSAAAALIQKYYQELMPTIQQA